MKKEIEKRDGEERSHLQKVPRPTKNSSTYKERLDELMKFLDLAHPVPDRVEPSEFKEGEEWQPVLINCTEDRDKV